MQLELEPLGPYIATFFAVLLLTTVTVLIGDRRFRQADSRMREAMKLSRSANPRL